MTSVGKIKSVSTTDENPRFKECLTQIKQLFEIRLVEKLASPIKKDRKQLIFNQFHHKFSRLHQVLNLIQIEYSGKTKQKQQFHRDQNSIKNLKDLTRQVQFAYKQLFVNGSFKYFVRVAVVVGFPLKLHIINIENWAQKILSNFHSQGTCC